MAGETITGQRPTEPLSEAEQKALDDIEAHYDAQAADYVQEVIALGAAYARRVREQLGTRALLHHFGREAAYHPDSKPRQDFIGHVRKRHIGASVRRALAWSQLVEARGGTPQADAVQVARDEALAAAASLESPPKVETPAAETWEQPVLVRVRRPGIRTVRQPEVEAETNDADNAVFEGQESLPGIDAHIRETERANAARLRELYQTDKLHTLAVLPDTEQFPLLAHWVASGRGSALEPVSTDSTTPDETEDQARKRLRLPIPQSWRDSAEQRRRKRQDKREEDLEELYANW